MTLRDEQVWMVAAITGAEIDSADVEKWITPSAKMTPQERLHVYRHGYVARLVECLEDDYKVIARCLDEDGFQSLCEAYIARHPSNSPNLNWFGRHMASFLRDRGEAFYSELAALEWSLVCVLHAEEPPKMDLSALQSLPIEAWESARFIPSEALRVFRFEYPTNKFFQAVFVDEEEPVLPEKSPSAVAVYRKDQTIWRMNLTPPMAKVLEPLVKGATFGEALAQLEDGETDPQNVMIWFREWVESGFFARVEVSAA